MTTDMKFMARLRAIATLHEYRGWNWIGYDLVAQIHLDYREDNGAVFSQGLPLAEFSSTCAIVTAKIEAKSEYRHTESYEATIQLVDRSERDAHAIEDTKKHLDLLQKGVGVAEMFEQHGQDIVDAYTKENLIRVQSKDAVDIDTWRDRERLHQFEPTYYSLGQAIHDIQSLGRDWRLVHHFSNVQLVDVTEHRKGFPHKRKKNIKQVKKNEWSNRVWSAG